MSLHTIPNEIPSYPLLWARDGLRCEYDYCSTEFSTAHHHCADKLLGVGTYYCTCNRCYGSGRNHYYTTKIEGSVGTTCLLCVNKSCPTPPRRV